jgi:hypothetical protein
MGSMDKRATRSLACICARRLSSSAKAKADDPVIAGAGERRGRGLDRFRSGYWMPAFAGMTTELEAR